MYFLDIFKGAATYRIKQFWLQQIKNVLRTKVIYKNYIFKVNEKQSLQAETAFYYTKYNSDI